MKIAKDDVCALSLLNFGYLERSKGIWDNGLAYSAITIRRKVCEGRRLPVSCANPPRTGEVLWKDNISQPEATLLLHKAHACGRRW